VGTATLNASGNDTLTTGATTLRGGPHNIVATYSGDKNDATTSGTLMQNVNKAPTSTTPHFLRQSFGQGRFGDFHRHRNLVGCGKTYGQRANQGWRNL
jgi:hypothetical protein